MSRESARDFALRAIVVDFRYDLGRLQSRPLRPRKRAAPLKPRRARRGPYWAGVAPPPSKEGGRPIRSVRRAYRPMAFGPLGRSFAARLELAGSHDQAWLDGVFPDLPGDFRYDYFQAAPPDQQIPYPSGGELVQLINLTPEPIAPFSLPSIDAPVCFVLADDTELTLSPVLDTIILEPDLRRLQLLWRTSLQLPSDAMDLHEVAVGHMSPSWHRARRAGKQYFRSLAELVDAAPEVE